MHVTHCTDLTQSTVSYHSSGRHHGRRRASETSCMFGELTPEGWSSCVEPNTERYYEYEERLGVITKKTQRWDRNIQMLRCKCTNLAGVTAEEEPTQGLRTMETAVTKEEDELSSCNWDWWRWGVILSIKETRMEEVTGFKKRKKSRLDRNL